MKINPFKETNAISVDEFRNWEELNSCSYNKKTATPYTKTRVILMNGTEFESNWFLHQFSRHCNNNELRREIAKIRRHEQQQQKLIASLKPLDENALESTIAYEQLAIDLTAILARHVKDEYVKASLNLALLEDFDHLYRFSNLMDMEEGKDAKSLTLDYTEIMPGRPTISEHRHPYDSINKFLCSQTADLFTRLVVNIITAAEQQTMNFYMNLGTYHPTEMGRKLYAEIAMIEEQHVTEYGSLLDTNCTWLENWLMHEYTESYLYYSCMMDETDPKIKELYRIIYLEECGHLQYVAKLLEKYQGCTYLSVFPCGGDFPEPLRFEGNIEYIREVIKNTVNDTRVDDGFLAVSELPKNSRFEIYNKMVNSEDEMVASHKVIEEYIDKNGQDYRYMVDNHPIKELDDRSVDNTTVGRKNSTSSKKK